MNSRILIIDKTSSFYQFVNDFYLASNVKIEYRNNVNFRTNILDHKNDILVVSYDCYVEGGIQQQITQVKNDNRPFVIVVNVPETESLDSITNVIFFNEKTPNNVILSRINNFIISENASDKNHLNIYEQFVQDSSSVSIFNLNHKYEIESWNSAAENIFQFNKEEILGKKIDLIIPDSSNETSIKERLGKEQISCLPCKGKRKDESVFNLSLSIFSIKSNNTEKSVVFCTDVSNIIRQREELNTYKYIIDKSAILLISDTKHKILDVNENYLNHYKYTKEEIIGEFVTKTVLKNQKSINIGDIRNQTSTGNVWRGVVREKSKNGHLFWMDVIIIPCLDEQNKVQKYITVKYDVTEKKLDEDYRHQKVIMERSLKMKDEFLANMSHEIRTPLNAILGYADLILESDLNSEQFKQAVTIKKSGKLLLSLINDILDLSKLESGKLTLDSRPFNIKEAIFTVKEMLELQAIRKELDFSFTIDPNLPAIVVGDPTRIEQILVNLINNAIKFTKIGYVKVSAEVETKFNTEVNIVFKVIDSGIGIPKEKIETIFESFTQTSKYITREFGGTGLGLTIVKKLINQLRGEILVDSELNKGSTFTIKIPFKLPSSNEMNVPIQPVKSLSYVQNKESLNLRVLLAEDNEYNRVLAQARLGTWKCEVDIATNGLEAIEKLRKNDYDLVLMDIQMPLMDGYEATKRIRTEFSGKKKKIPVIALTAHASNGSASEAKKVGFNDYLFKPFDSELLYAKLKEYGNASISENNVNQEIITESNQASKLVDFTFIESESLGHKNIIKILIESFLKEFEMFLTNAKEATANEDWNGVYKAVHRIGPSVSNFNLKTIRPQVKNLYDMSKLEEETHTYIFTIQEIENAFETLTPIFQEKLLELERKIA